MISPSCEVGASGSILKRTNCIRPGMIPRYLLMVSQPIHSVLAQGLVQYSNWCVESQVYFRVWDKRSKRDTSPLGHVDAVPFHGQHYRGGP